jgi:vacuolar protein sorting-associated protein IST1
MSVQRIQLLKNKKTVHSKQQKREIATLLSNKKEEMARIRVEHIIRDDFNIEALELIEMLCELVYERISLITKDRTCPPEMLSAVCSLMWAAGQIDIEELKDVANS